MRYWFLPLAFALCASAHNKPHDHKHGHNTPNSPTCAQDEFQWYDGKCVKQQCPPDRIRNSYGACVCPEGQVLSSIGQCVCPPGMEKASGGNYCQTICKPECLITCRERFTLVPEECKCICLPGLVQVGDDCACPYGQVWKENKCVCLYEGQVFDGDKCVCPYGQVWKENKCVCLYEGQVFDGDKCVCPTGQRPEGDKCVSCPYGQILKGNDCVCPDGTNFSSTERRCVSPPGTNCSSGVQTGKCYTFTFGNGQLFGYDSNARFYTASPDLQFSKFQVCTDELCSSPTEDIKAGMPFNLQEIVGPEPPNSTQRSRIFVSDAKHEGPYLARTPFFITSGRFIIAKWPGGKHCLGGYDTGVGVGLTYEDGIVGATMLSDDQSCIVFTLTEVPCDIRACIEENKTGTPATPGSGEASSNASMPLNSGVSGYT